MLNSTVCLLVYDSYENSIFYSIIIIFYFGFGITHEFYVTKYQFSCIVIVSIGQIFSHVNSKCSVKLKAKHSYFSVSISCLVVKELGN